MKTRFWYAATFAVALLVTTGAWAQDHDQFSDHDRQVAREWADQHRDTRGLREADRNWFRPEHEQRLLPGRPFDREFRRHAYYPPEDFRQRLPPPPRGHVYVVIGGHVVLVDQAHHVVRAVIHLHD
ncbi:MAG TPA: RcnB family protein [Thermoanaerobaculia bacterium]|jgi:Ni/Co efflux regulator RcnB|nr:RcnB family protein [Thermoanaerobaculia bacterium]